MRGISQVEYLDLLLDGVADGYREFCLAVPESVIIEDGPHGNDRRLVVSDLNSYGIGKGHNADSPRMKVHSDVFLEFLDLGDLHSWCGINLV